MKYTTNPALGKKVTNRTGKKHNPRITAESILAKAGVNNTSAKISLVSK